MGREKKERRPSAYQGPVLDSVEDLSFLDVSTIADKKEESTSKETDKKVVCVKQIHNDVKGQAEVINFWEDNGYVHYESCHIGGNEVILRFRKISHSI